MSKDVNVENMYEGKNIGIILNKTKLENFVIQEFVLDENINEHQKLEIQLEMDDEQRKNLERIIEKARMSKGKFLVELLIILRFWIMGVMGAEF